MRADSFLRGFFSFSSTMNGYYGLSLSTVWVKTCNKLFCIAANISCTVVEFVGSDSSSRLVEQHRRFDHGSIAFFDCAFPQLHHGPDDCRGSCGTHHVGTPLQLLEDHVVVRVASLFA